MSNLNAIGYLLDYCNRNLHKPEVTQERFEAGAKEILSSPEGRFHRCHSATDVLRELGWEPI